jgi:adenylosuccinate lyase
LRVSASLCSGLVVHPERASANLTLNGGAILAEAYMMHLAAGIGRDRAHDLVYRAVRVKGERSLYEALTAEADVATIREVRADQYLGETARVCATALASWQQAARSLGDNGEVPAPALEASPNNGGKHGQ